MRRRAGAGMTPKFTPGPHVVNPIKAVIEAVCDGPDKPICGMLWPTDLRSEEETLANAQLYAAAPEMFALLERMENAREYCSISGLLEIAKAWLALRARILEAP